MDITSTFLDDDDDDDDDSPSTTILLLAPPCWYLTRMLYSRFASFVFGAEERGIRVVSASAAVPYDAVREDGEFLKCDD